jgi:2-oxoglutarate dehydrogenase complex dehydrogenase (E1) component-like enzyme
MSTLGGVWTGLTHAGDDWEAKTAVSVETKRQVAGAAIRVPAGFAINPKLQRLLTARRDMVEGKRPVDWGCAELLAFGSLLLEGMPVRLAGEDSERGTFSQRHAVWYDVQTDDRYISLAHLGVEQAPFTILNTMLSELAVLGFEYGISSADPRRLVLWEAQFGDFANGAQPIIDQFIASAEAKWQRMSGLVLLLPHGYEGQGPEHSSARLERYLQLCAERNMQVCYPTTPAQYFHVLRRQMHRSFRKPLILMTPKSLLRHERSTSALEEFAAGGFLTVIDDPAVASVDRVHRVLLCSGKIYYDVVVARDERGLAEIAVVRVEQLYPFSQGELRGILRRYRQATTAAWVQEEPRNMGAWNFVQPWLRQLLPDAWELAYCGRDEAASPATGFHSLHQSEQAAIIDQALDGSASRPQSLAPAGNARSQAYGGPCGDSPP